MKEIIGRFEADDKEIAKWTKAADTWRLPYWDWSTEHVPEAVRTVEFSIVAPVIQPAVLIGNPLHKFTNPSLKPMGDPSMGDFKIRSHDDGKHGNYPV